MVSSASSYYSKVSNSKQISSFPLFIANDHITVLLKSAHPLTLPYTDLAGRTIQLWKYKNLLIASLEKNGSFCLVSGKRIYNALQNNENGEILLKRIEGLGLRKWHFSYIENKGSIAVWPYLCAAGKFDWISHIERSINHHKNTIKVKNHPPKGMFPEGSKEAKQETRQYSDLKAAHRESRGEVVKEKSSGIPYDHKKEVNNSQRGLKNLIIRIKQHLNSNNNLTPEHRTRLEKALSQASQMLDGSEGYIKSPAYKTNTQQRKPPGNGPSGGGGPGGKFHPPTPGMKQFGELLQKNGLTPSYNNNHADHPVAAKGCMSGEIGGVGCNTELIQGLFDTPDSLFENTHLFCLPTLPDGQLPMTNLELQQILRELAIGIYVYDTVPFFSLHFNQNADLYPVIHPAYENTLVGQVISFLDYFMKGYLNGGIFKEEFIRKWEEDPSWKGKEKSALQEMIDFTTYCRAHLQGDDRDYTSLRELLGLGIDLSMLGKASEALEEAFGNEPPIFRDNTLFTNSFRIIAKQRSIQKTDNLFVLDSDFDVFYTIDPAPAYKKELEQYQKIHGKPPFFYQRMVEAYELMRKNIHDHMVKLPLCSKYFAMLGLINFFCSYMMTLKKQRKVPIFPQIQPIQGCGSPALFPHLPLKQFKKIELRINPSEALHKLASNNKALLKEFFGVQEPSEATLLKMTQALAQKFIDSVMSSSSGSLRHFLENNPDFLRPKFEQISKELLIELKKAVPLVPDKDSPIFAKGEFQMLGIMTGIDHHLFSQNKAMLVLKTSIPYTHLQSDAEPQEIEQGKRIVGGCGMTLSPMSVVPSLKGEAILQEHWAEVQQLELQTWAKVGSGTVTEGAVFKMMFEDLPPEMEEDYSWMENLFFASSSESLRLSDILQKLKEAMLSDNGEEFGKLINAYSSDLSQLRGSHGMTILHIAAMQKNPVYLRELLRKGLSPSTPDKKKYLPIHYAAMSGNVDNVVLLLDADPKSLSAESNDKLTPLFVAVQQGQEAVVHLLLSRKANYNIVNSSGYTPLHSALHQGYEGIAMKLLSQPDIQVDKATEEGVTPLMLACELDSEKLAQELLRRKANPAAERKDGVTALDIAAKRNCLSVCKLLLPLCKLSEFTIETAIKDATLEMLKLLSAHPSFLTYRNYAKDTPLILAIRYGNIPAALHILSLIPSPIDLSVENVFGETAISLCSACGFVDLLEAMIKKGALVHPMLILPALCKAGMSPFLKDYIASQQLSSEDLQYLLKIAARAGQYLVISMILMPLKVNLDALEGPDDWKIEHYLAKANGIFLLRLRLAKSRDFLQRLPFDGNKTLAYIAAENGSWGCFKMLLTEMLNNKISLDNHYHSRHLAYAVMERGDLNGVRLFWELFPDHSWIHADLDGRGTTAAHLAAQKGSKEILKLLQSKGASLDQEDAAGKTPLYYAIRSESEKAVKFLVKHGKVKMTSEALYLAFSLGVEAAFLNAGADLNTKSPRTQDTPLLLAIKNHDYEAFVKLIQSKADLDCMNAEGWTPMLLASDLGEHKIIEAMIRQGYVDKRTFKGDNALHLACKKEHAGCIKLLVSAGFSTDQPNQEHKTPRDLAFYSNSSLAALGMKEREHHQLIDQFVSALHNADLTTLQRMRRLLPINDRITIMWENQQITGTFLHLILRLIKDSKSIRPLVDALLEDPSLDIQLQDSEGLTYSHLMVKAKLPLKQLPLHVVDFKGRTPLHYAAQLYDKISLKELFETTDAEKLIDVSDQWGQTPLFYAIRIKNQEAAEFLIKQGSNFNHADYELITPLILASKIGFFFGVRQLVEAGADMNKRGTIHQWTPLFISLTQESDEISLYLMMKGADCRAPMSDGTTLAHAAAQSGKPHMLRFLARKGASLTGPDDQGFYPIHVAASQGHNPALAVLLNEGVCLETKSIVPQEFREKEAEELTEEEEEEDKASRIIRDLTPLHAACRNGRVDTAAWLLNRHADPESKFNDNLGILTSAAVVNSTEMIELFKPYKLSRDPDQLFPAIGIAIFRDNVNSVAQLYRQGIPINIDIEGGMTGLHFACQSGAIRTTHFLLNQGVIADFPNKKGQKPIELAAANNSVDQFWTMLMRTEPDLDAPNRKGETLLHISVRAKKVAHAMLLINYGAALDVLDNSGEAPLHVAVKKGYVELVGLLIGCGADHLKKTYLDEKTARELSDNAEINNLIDRYHAIKSKAQPEENLLHLAVKANLIQAVKVLSSHVDIDQAISDGSTALHLAVGIKSVPIIRLLLSQGADLEIQDGRGHTPLWWACLSAKNPLLVRFLIRAGASKNHRDKEGQSIPQRLGSLNFPEKEQILRLLS